MAPRFDVRASGLLLAALSASIFAACGSPETMAYEVDVAASPAFAMDKWKGGAARRAPAEQIEKIIGQNDLLRVVENGTKLLNQKGESVGMELPEQLRSKLDAFGHMSMGCTATHIGGGIALSAGHCFRAPRERSSTRECGSVTVKWGQRHDKREYLVSKCVEVLAYQLNDDTDYAIFRVDSTPRIALEIDPTPVATDTAVTIFGYPRGRPLEWSQTCRVRPAKSGNWGADQFSHQCDTEPGSSGAVVISSQSGKIVGIHDGGIAPWNYATYINRIPLRLIPSAARANPL